MPSAFLRAAPKNPQRTFKSLFKSAKVCHKRAKKRHRGAQGQGHVTHLNLTVCFAKRTQVHVVES